MDTPILSEGAGTADADLIKNTTTKDFIRDVVEASREVPVLVDFWAPWCGPCRQLTPILEKAVRAAKGAVKLVKLNIDDHPQIPGQMGVQSIPAVFAFQDGRPVDGFMGALPESRVKSFIARLIGDETADVAADMEDAEAALAAGDVNSAAQAFGEALQKDAENARAAVQVPGKIRTCRAVAPDQIRLHRLEIRGNSRSSSSCRPVHLSREIRQGLFSDLPTQHTKHSPNLRDRHR